MADTVGRFLRKGAMREIDVALPPAAHFDVDGDRSSSIVSGRMMEEGDEFNEDDHSGGNSPVGGISIASDISTAKKAEAEAKNPKQSEDKVGDYMSLKEENEKIKRDLEDAKAEKELKAKECREALILLSELQKELTRKSMHVGSLAFAVEGQVEEKTRWRQSLRELSEKFKLLKLEHAKLSSEASVYWRCLVDMSSLSATIQSASEEFIVLKEKFVKESKERKELYNKVLEQKGNIRVFCRCRPLTPEESSLGVSTVVDFDFSKDGELVVRAPGSLKKVFKFDCVFGPHADQEMVFENTSPFATSVMDGYNVCIFAYGQTGTGKTFTMEGTREARGVNYRILEKLFDVVKERQGLFEYEISVSVLEVYNEQIRDLLLPGVTARRLEIKQVAGVHHVPGLVESRVSNMDEAWGVLQTGANARAMGATNCNEHSSRSHCIHCVMVKGKSIISGEFTRSKMWLIDLAGSERVAKTDARGDRLKEAQSINKSLSALGDVISALTSKSAHVPFRNSKLTHLLQDSLGGESKTLMFLQISPKKIDVVETVCSLNFGSRVRGIELGPPKRLLDSTNETSKTKQMLEKVKQEIQGKDDQIKRMDEAAICLELKIKSKNMTIRNLQDRVKELESQLMIERKLARQHVDSRIAENHHQQLQRLHEQEGRAPLTAISTPSDDNDHQFSITSTGGAATSPPGMAVVLKENKPASDGRRRRVAVKSILRKSLQKKVVVKAKSREEIVHRPAELEQQRMRKERERQWGI